MLKRTLRIVLLVPLVMSAQTFTDSPDLARLAQDTVNRAVEKFAPGGLTPDRIALTLIDLNDPAHPAWGSYRGEEKFYPASVCKLFYLNAIQAWIEDGKVQETPELDRAIHDMIVSSSNDATQLVVDTLTGTTGGPELPPAEIEPWLGKRNAVNRYYAALGYR